MSDPLPTSGGRSPADLLAEETSLTLASLNELDAIAIGQRILARATRDGLPVTIEVRRGARAVFRALPGSSADNDAWIARKARVTERYGHSSLYVRVRYEAAGTTFEAATGLPAADFAPFGGAVPLVVAGTGAIGVAIVSGLAQLDDHDLVVAGIREHLAAAATGSRTAQRGGGIASSPDAADAGAPDAGGSHG